jgi:hypothetical protein
VRKEQKRKSFSFADVFLTFSETQKEDINKELKASERKIMIDIGQEEKSLRKSVKNRQVFKI